MSDEIVNRVAKSKLKTLDLEDFYPKGERVLLDISPWLYEGVILKEKDFRDFVSKHNWKQYKDKFVALYCTSDAIIPAWAYLLLSTELSPFARTFVVGDLNLLENMVFREIVEKIPLEPYRGVPVIIKGCSDKHIPETAYAQLVQRLLPVVSSLMFGDACSSVPLYKKKK
jgi:hypothetical protein